MYAPVLYWRRELSAGQFWDAPRDKTRIFLYFCLVSACEAARLHFSDTKQHNLLFAVSKIAIVYHSLASIWFSGVQ